MTAKDKKKIHIEPDQREGRDIDVRDLARLITGIECREPTALQALAKLHSGEARATNHEPRIIGITGPPGSGKSTLVDGMIRALRKKGRLVGVVAIDPSSPFSGGAVLGDRIRMQEHAGDRGVFIRSLGSRGSHGGLSRATRDIVRAIMAYGYDYVIVETVGVGQTELDIMEIADATVVVLVPESGDMVQTMKAGLLEIADIFVVNKCDRPGADQMKNWLTGMFDTGSEMDAEAAAHHGVDAASHLPPLKKGGRGGFKEKPVLLTQANKGTGVNELMDALEARLKFAKTDKGYKERKRIVLKNEFLDMCADEFRVRFIEYIDINQQIARLVKDVSEGKISPYEGLIVIDKFIKIGE